MYGSKVTAGTIPDAYSSWSRTLPEGLTNVDDTLYLCIPNGWEGRLWHYPWWCGSLYWHNNPRNDMHSPSPTADGCINNEKERDYYHETTHILNTDVMWDKLCVKFGNRRKLCKDDLVVPTTVNDISKKDKNTIIKFNITVKENNSYVDIYLMNTKRTITISYGDGSIESMNVSSHISHRYGSKGTYTIVISNASINEHINSIKPSYNNGNVSVDYTKSMFGLVVERDDYTSKTSYTINSISINPNFLDMINFENSATFDSDLVEYSRGIHINYQKNLSKLAIPYGLYLSNNSYLDIKWSNIKDLYIYGNCDFLHLINTEPLNNIYCSSNVSNIFLDDIVLDSSLDTKLYLYNENETTISTTLFYDAKNDKILSEKFSKLLVYVKPSIYDVMSSLYPWLDIRSM